MAVTNVGLNRLFSAQSMDRSFIKKLYSVGLQIPYTDCLYILNKFLIFLNTISTFLQFKNAR